MHDRPVAVSQAAQLAGCRSWAAAAVALRLGRQAASVARVLLRGYISGAIRGYISNIAAGAAAAPAAGRGGRPAPAAMLLCGARRAMAIVCALQLPPLMRCNGAHNVVGASCGSLRAG